MRKRVKEEEREREKATDRICIYIERKKNKEKETKILIRECFFLKNNFFRNNNPRKRASVAPSHILFYFWNEITFSVHYLSRAEG